MNGKIAFIKEYRRLAPQMTDFTTAGNWMRLAEALKDAGMPLTAEESARWAGRGFWPEEAGQLILDGITIDQYIEMEEHTAALAGGQDALAELRIAELMAAAENPDDYVIVGDPTDQRQVIAMHRDELGGQR